METVTINQQNHPNEYENDILYNNLTDSIISNSILESNHDPVDLEVNRSTTELISNNQSKSNADIPKIIKILPSDLSSKDLFGNAKSWLKDFQIQFSNDLSQNVEGLETDNEVVVKHINAKNDPENSSQSADLAKIIQDIQDAKNTEEINSIIDNQIIRKYNLISPPTFNYNIATSNFHLVNSSQIIEPPKEALKKNYRTDNGVKSSWIKSKNCISDLSTPGILETECKIMSRERKNKNETKSKRVLDDEDLISLNQVKSHTRNLTNPRFSTLPEQAANEVFPLNGIVAIPSSIFFTDYFPGQTYTQTLTIQNKTNQSRRFRIFPQAYQQSPHFSSQLIKPPIQNDGLVAPGLSTQFEITFKPDSLADFEHMLCVRTEFDANFTIPVIARRKPPILTLPNILNCGPCRAGFENTRIWEFQNIGGPGKFLFLTENDMRNPILALREDSRFDDEVVVISDQFTIKPAKFSMKEGEFRKLTIKYIPQDLDDFERTDQTVFRVACDNCQVLQVPVVGVAQKPILEVQSLTDESEVSVTDFKCNQRFDATVDFGKRNPFTSTMYKLQVRNRSLLKLPFHWKVYDNPGVIVGRNAVLQEVSQNINITPARGVLDPDSTTSFLVTFVQKNQDIRKYDILVELMLLEHETSELNHPSTTKILHINCLAEIIPQKVSVSPPIVSMPSTLFSGKIYSTRLLVLNESLSDIVYNWRTKDINPNFCTITSEQLSGTIKSGEEQVFIFSIYAKLPTKIKNGSIIFNIDNSSTITIPFQADIKMKPGVIGIDESIIDFGILALGEYSNKKIPLKNNSNMDLKYQLKVSSMNLKIGDANVLKSNIKTRNLENPDCFLEIDPKEGILRSGENIELNLVYVPLWKQNLKAVMGLFITDVIFADSHDGIELPQSGNFKTEAVQHLLIESSAIEIRSEVLTKSAYIQDPFCEFSCFINVPINLDIILCNATNIPTSFRFIESNDENKQIKFNPSHGELFGEEKRKVGVNVTFHNTSDVQEFRLVCKIDGMVENNGEVEYKLKVYVSGLNVKFAILEEEISDIFKNRSISPSIGQTSQKKEFPKNNRELVEDFTNIESPSTSPRSSITDTTIPTELPKSQSKKLQLTANAPEILELNFGSECQIFESRQKTLEITNHSAISTPFRVWVEKFPVSHLAKFDFNTTPEQSIRGKLNGVGFTSEAGEKYMKSVAQHCKLKQDMKNILSEGRGAAFSPSPEFGVLPPYGKCKITLFSFDNLVGIYNDNLVIEMGDYSNTTLNCGGGNNFLRKIIPIRMVVTGVPVKFSGIHVKYVDSIPRINFGTKIVTSSRESESPIRTTGNDISNIETNSLNSNLLKPPKSINLHTLLLAQNKVDSFSDSAFGQDLFEVNPKRTKICAFDVTTVQITFNPHNTGIFNAILLADIGYIQKDSSVLYGSELIEKNSNSLNEVDPTNISFAKLNLFGVSITPKLTLDMGNRIKLKIPQLNKSTPLPSIPKVKEFTQSEEYHKESAECFQAPLTSSKKKIGIKAELCKKSVFSLRNPTNALTRFALEVSPKSNFFVECIGKSFISDSTQSVETKKLEGRKSVHLSNLKLNTKELKSRYAVTNSKPKLVPEVSFLQTVEIIDSEPGLSSDSYQLNPTEELQFEILYKPLKALRPALRTSKTDSMSFKDTTDADNGGKNNEKVICEGDLKVIFENGMIQNFPVIVEKSMLEI
ncbi:Deleted in lung and esophageal cancer protein 1 [Nowakowskiella sp. JEL0407]|nr:Deleted in lung and esophageal cancer protein 1 [Nowakowskiella sp. JEL0407]